MMSTGWIPMRPAFVAGLLFACLCLAPIRSEAAVGCTLSNPAQDLKYLFPEMTTYKEELRELSRMKDGRALYQVLRERLRSDLDPVYETYETPYTVYTVFRGKEIIGIVHGVNVPGEGGLIQVFVSAEPQTAEIRRVFYQRLESAAARQLRNRNFLGQFESLTLADFYRHDYFQASDPGNSQDRVARIKNPVTGARGAGDYEASLRGVRKNLILLDIFVYERKFEPVYQETRKSLNK